MKQRTHRRFVYSILLFTSVLLCAGLARRAVALQQVDDAYFKPIDSGPGILICEPVSTEGSATLADFGSGCSLWLQWCMGFNPEPGQTPRFDLIIRACQEMHLPRLRLAATQAKRLHNILGVTHVVVGQISGTESKCSISYQLYAVPAQQMVGQPIKLIGSEMEITAQLPAAARAILKQLGVKALHVPESVGASPADLALAGHYNWYNSATPADPDQERIDKSAETFPLAALLAFVHAAKVSGRPDEAAARKLVTQTPDNFLGLGEISTIITKPSADFGRFMDNQMEKVTSTTYWPKLYWAASRAHNVSETVAALEKLVRIERFSSSAWVNLAKTYGDQGESIRNGRVAAAISPQEYEKLETIYRRWKYSAERVAALDADYVAGWYELAMASTFAGDPQRADEAIWKALSLDNTDTRLFYWGLEMYQPKWGGDPKTLAKVAHLAATAPFSANTDIYGLGNELRSAGFPTEAKSLIERAIAAAREMVSQHPNSSAAHARLGYYLNNQNMPDQALPELQTAIRLDPDSDVGHFQLAILYNNQRKFSDAIPHYRESVRITNGFNARSGLASALANAGQLEEAEKLMRDLAKLQPNQWLPHSQLGWVMLQKKQFDAATVEYQEAERLGPEYEEPHRELCNLYQIAKKYDLAIEEGEMATRISANDFWAHVYLARSYASSDDTANATKAYRRANEISPNSADAHFELGKLLIKTGNKADGRAELKRVVEMKNAGDLKKSAQELLDNNP